MSIKETARGGAQLLVDLGPIIVFVVSFNLLKGSRPDTALYWATGLFMAATLIAIAFSRLRSGRVPPTLFVTGALVLVFGGLTLLLRDPNLIKVKPTFVYFFYAAAIFGALTFGVNVWKMLFGHAFTLPDAVWRTLAIRWGAFFIGMALLNEAIRLTQTTDVWVNSRLFVGFPLVALFMLANLPITLKHIGKSEVQSR